MSEGVEYEISALSNIAAYIYDNMIDVNWVGFYLLRDGKPQRNSGRLGRGRRRLLCSREVPPAEGEARIRDRSAASLSSWRALTTPGMIVFTSVSSGIMLLLWVSVLIGNAM
jgi:hypothetical protein